MRQAAFVAWVVVGAALVAPRHSAAEARQIVIAWSDRIDSVTLNDSISRLRISSADSVSLRVTHFNFLHYSLKFTIEERTIESYVLLDKLWSQIFKAVGPLTEALGTPFDQAIVAWRRRLATTDVSLGEFVRKYSGRISLTEEERREIEAQAGPLGSKPMEDLEVLRRDALGLTETSADFDLYERILAQHTSVIARLAAFVKAADLVAKGQVYPIGSRRAGTVVTFTITPVDAKEARVGQPFQSSYFVRSTRPLLLHVGYAASRLKDIEFDRVRSATGSDLFLSTKSNETTQSLVTFMSYELWRYGPTDEIGAHVTLGTSFQKPGETLFVGGGIRFTRFVFSLGFSGSGVREGAGRVLETIAGAAGQRELFTTVTSRQKWEPFGAVSIRVF